MQKVVAEILERALTLPEEDRGALADVLIESLDSASEGGVLEAWKAEVRKRIAEIDSGEVQLVEWSDVREKMWLNTKP